MSAIKLFSLLWHFMQWCSPRGQVLALKFLWPWPWDLVLQSLPQKSRPWPWDLVLASEVRPWHSHLCPCLKSPDLGLGTLSLPQKSDLGLRTYVLASKVQTLAFGPMSLPQKSDLGLQSCSDNSLASPSTRGPTAKVKLTRYNNKLIIIYYK